MIFHTGFYRADTTAFLRFPFTTVSHRLGLRSKYFKKRQKIHGSKTCTSSLAHGRPRLISNIISSPDQTTRSS